MKKIFIARINKQLISRTLLGSYVIASLIFMMYLVTTSIITHLIAYGMDMGKDEIVNSIFQKLESDPCYHIEVFKGETKYILKNVDCSEGWT